MGDIAKRLRKAALLDGPRGEVVRAVVHQSYGIELVEKWEAEPRSKGEP